jgi:chemotaxis methyl-accepting protein methylase
MSGSVSRQGDRGKISPADRSSLTTGGWVQGRLFAPARANGSKLPSARFGSPCSDAEEVDCVRDGNHRNLPGMTNLEYRIWRDFIQQRCGLYFAENRLSFMSRRLENRMRVVGIPSYSEYFHYVSYNPTGEEEWKELLELLLNLETGFFRHLPSFEALTGHMLPGLMRQKRGYGDNNIAMWSAGCSIGAEPYSLVMAFLDMVAADGTCSVVQDVPLDQAGWQLRVSGTDICRRSLEKARRGTYKPHEVRYMPDLYRENYITKIEGEQGVLYQVDKQVRKMINFGYLIDLLQTRSPCRDRSALVPAVESGWVPCASSG